jgi:hypothetical protein
MRKDQSRKQLLQNERDLRGVLVQEGSNKLLDIAMVHQLAGLDDLEALIDQDLVLRKLPKRNNEKRKKR